MIYRLLGIQTNDLSKLLNLGPVFFLTGIAYLLGLLASKSLFISRFGVEYLPIIFLIQACLLPLQLWFLGYISQKLVRGKMIKLLYISITLIFLGLTIFLFSMILFNFEWLYFYPILDITVDILLKILIPLMWMLGDGACTLQQGKRLFPLLTVIFTIGGGIGGLIGNNFGKLFVGNGTEMTFLMMQVLLIISIFFWMRVISKYFLSAGIEAESDIGTPMSEVIKHVWNAPLLKITLIGFILLMSLYNVIDYRFFILANEKFPNSDELTSFYGLFLVMVYAASLVVGLNLNKLFTKLGIGFTLLGMGVITLFAFIVSSLLAGTDWAFQVFIIVNIALDILVYTLLPTLSQVFYKLLPVQLRSGVSLLFAGCINAGGKLVSAGITGLHSSSLITLLGLSIIGITMAIIYLILTWKQKKLYLTSLLNSLYSNAVRATEIVSFNLGQLLSKADLLPLRMALDSNDSIKQLVGLELAGHIRQTSMYPEVKRFLDSDDSRKRELALQAIPDGVPEINEIIYKALVDEDQEVRSLAVKKLSTLSENKIESLLKYLDDPSPKVVKEAILALARKDKEGHAHIIRKGIERLLVGNSNSKVQACLIIQEIKHIEDNEYEDKLLRLLVAEESVSVRSAIISCLGLIGSHLSVQPLLESYKTTDREMQKIIVEALIKIGEPGVETLLANLDSDNLQIWEGVINSLTGIQEKLQSFEIVEKLNLSCKYKIDCFLKIRDFIKGINSKELEGVNSLFQQRMSEVEEVIIAGSLKVLALYVDPVIVQRLQENLKSGVDNEQKENAQEVLSELGREHNLTRQILQLFTEDIGDEEMDVVIRLQKIKMYLNECPDYWLMKFTDYAIAQYHREDVAHNEA